MKFMSTVALAAILALAAAGEEKKEKRGLHSFGYGLHGSLDSHLLTKTIEVPVPQPYPVHIDKPYPVPQPYPVHRPYKVEIPKPYPVTVEKPVPIHVDRPVPYPVKVPVKVPIIQRVEVPVPKPYPVPVDKPYPVPVPKPIYIEKQVPVYINNDHGLHSSYDYSHGHQSAHGLSYNKYNTHHGVVSTVTHHGHSY